jgi:hypothetical protein
MVKTRVKKPSKPLRSKEEQERLEDRELAVCPECDAIVEVLGDYIGCPNGHGKLIRPVAATDFARQHDPVLQAAERERMRRRAEAEKGLRLPLADRVPGLPTYWSIETMPGLFTMQRAILDGIGGDDLPPNKRIVRAVTPTGKVCEFKRRKVIERAIQAVLYSKRK